MKVCDGTGHHYEVRLTRRSPRHFKAESCKVISGGSDGHEFDSAAARGESQRPQTVAASPFYHIVKAADNDISAVVAQFLEHLLDIFIVVEILVFHRLYIDITLHICSIYISPVYSNQQHVATEGSGIASGYFHSRAPFFHA